MFQRLFQLCRGAPTAAKPVALPTIDLKNYYAAGCAFLSETHVLGGYQPHKRKPGITGIGGMKDLAKDSDYIDTAFRETVEEMYEISIVPVSLMARLRQTMVPKRVVNQGGYVTLLFTFEDLKKFLRICREAKLRTPLYATMPKTLEDLVHKRIPRIGAEVELLCLLPNIAGLPFKSAMVRREFVEDIRHRYTTSPKPLVIPPHILAKSHGHKN